MMNYVWSAFILIAIFFGIVSGNTSTVADSVLNAGESSIKLLLTLAGTISLWSGIMAVADSCGITKWLSTLFSPVLKFLFPQYKNNNKVMNYVSINITANLLGLGNAATPAGLKAVSAMYQGDNTANSSMATFIVMNTSSIQLIPTTIVALRISAGSTAPMEIITCIWISSVTALLVGITATKLFYFKKSNIKMR
ncbi:MAG: spore maturation protein A [Acutalibacteraceae bacterium]|nr:spore maturation protein A [Acutalibacteraceae bacterium]